jgi:hypothetical protein
MPLRRLILYLDGQFYIEDDCAYLQNSMIFAEDTPKEFNIDELDEVMPSRGIFDDENQKISEWKTTKLSIFDFSN